MSDILDKKWIRSYKVMILGTIPFEPNIEKKTFSQIKLYKPSIILNQYTPSGILIPPENSEFLLKEQDVINDFGVDLTNLLHLSLDFNIPLFGIDEEYEIVKSIKDFNLSYYVRESRMVKYIYDYYIDSADYDNRISVLVNDVHLRYFSNPVYGETSSIIKNFIYKDDILFQRVSDEEREADNSDNYNFQFSKLTSTKTKYCEFYVFTNIYFKSSNLEKYLKIGRIEILSRVYNTYKIRPSKYILLNNNDKTNFVFFTIDKRYKPFGLLKHAIREFIKRFLQNSNNNGKDFYTLITLKEEKLMKELNLLRCDEYREYLPRDKRDEIICYSLSLNQKKKKEIII